MKIVLVWAGGSGISNLAYILQELGYTNLLAIDGYESQITHGLEKAGIPLIIGHGKYEVKADDLVIYSEAVVNSPEVQSAFQLKLSEQQPLKIWNYFQFLGEMSKYFRTVGFAGTNGKSSSTALAIKTASSLIPELGIGIVGALIPDFDNKSYYLKQDQKSDFRLLFDAIFTGRKLPYELIKKRYFFVEACEYKRHFLNLDLEKLVITNIELDHTDYYVNLEDYSSAFEQMMAKTHGETFILEDVLDGEQVCLQRIMNDPSVVQTPTRHRKLQHIWGNHTDQNASLVAGVLQSIDPTLTVERIEQAMSAFKGIWRRMECLWTLWWKLGNWALLYSDYGHIASSIEFGYAMLRQKYPDKSLIAVFQPHQMHRVLTGWEAFPQAMENWDEKYIYPIYAARENISDFVEEGLFLEHKIESVEQLGKIFAEHCHAEYLADFEELKSKLESVWEDAVVVVFTAGDLDFQLRKMLKL